MSQSRQVRASLTERREQYECRPSAPAPTWILHRACRQEEGRDHGDRAKLQARTHTDDRPLAEALCDDAAYHVNPAGYMQFALQSCLDLQTASSLPEFLVHWLCSIRPRLGPKFTSDSLIA